MRRTTIAVFLTLAAVAAAHAQRSPWPAAVGSENAPRRVLIAAENTRFKISLVERMVSLLDDGNTHVVVVDHSRNGLHGVDPRDYSAVFITNSGARAQVRPAVMQWLEQVAANDRNVVLHTTQINNWDPPVKVDSVTSASSMGDLNTIADTLVRRIRRHL